jgi:hypothetical protein
MGYTGSNDGDGKKPVIEAVAANPGQFRFKFSNKTPINGILNFFAVATGAGVTKVTILFPPRRATATSSETSGVSGFIPSFRAGTTSPDNTAAPIALPAEIGLSTVLPLDAAGDEQAAITINQGGACTGPALAPAAFATIPTQQLVQLPPVGAVARTFRFVFPTGTGNNQGQLYVIGWDFAGGETITFAPSVNSAGASVVSGLTEGTLNGNVFTVGPPTAPATSVTLNGIFGFFGTQTHVDVTVFSNAVGGLRRRDGAADTFAGTDAQGNLKGDGGATNAPNMSM